MTAATYTSNLVDIFLFESTTGVTAYGGGAAGLTAEPDFAMEGTNAVDKQITASADKGFLFAAAAAFVPTKYDHFYEWIYAATFGILDSLANNGISVGIGDDTNNFVKFHVDGNDTIPVGSAGKPYVVDFKNTAVTGFRTLVGTPGTTPDNIGGGLNVTGNSKDINLGIDAARMGNGIIVLLGTGADDPADFASIASTDETTQEGIFQNTVGGFNFQGKIYIGNSITVCEFTDSNKNLFILDTLHGAENLTEIIISAMATPGTTVNLTNINFIAVAGKQQTVAGNNPNRGRLELVHPLVDAQTETSYDNSPTTEGTFSGGSGHAVSDVLLMSDDSEVTVNAVSGGVVTQFTVQSNVAPTATTSGIIGRNAVAGTAITQVSSDGSGIDFSLTPDTDNIRTILTCNMTGCAFIGFGKTVLLSDAVMSNCRWVSANQITANGADLTGSTVESFDDMILIDAQDETSWNNTPTTEGTFGGGSGHAVSDILTMSDGSLITVDAVSTGTVTQFTVDSSNAVASEIAVPNTQLATDGSGTGFSMTPDIDNLTEVAALQWLDNLDPDGELDNMTFIKGTNPTHAIEFGAASPLTMTVRGLTSTGYNASDANKDSFFWVRRTSGTVTINVIGSTGNFSYKSDGATVNVVIDPVTTLVNVKDNLNVNLSGARVLLEASDATGDFPFVENVTITRSGATATVAHTAHGMVNGDIAIIRGAAEPEYNGPHVISNVSANAYDYTVSGTPATPSVGTRIVDGQFQTSYDNSPTSEGTFFGGAGYAVNDLITLTDGTVVDVSSVSVGVVNGFTIISTGSRGGHTAGDTILQASTDWSGTGFTLTPDTDNLTVSASGAILNGTTDGSGNISASRTFTADQPVKGVARKSSAAPRFKNFPLSGTIDNANGLTINIRLALDQ
jgi:hypothetical protein